MRNAKSESCRVLKGKKNTFEFFSPLASLFFFSLVPHRDCSRSPRLFTRGRERAYAPFLCLQKRRGQGQKRGIFSLVSSQQQQQSIVAFGIVDLLVDLFLVVSFFPLLAVSGGSSISSNASDKPSALSPPLCSSRSGSDKPQKKNNNNDNGPRRSKGRRVLPGLCRLRAVFRRRITRPPSALRVPALGPVMQRARRNIRRVRSLEDRRRRGRTGEARVR